MAAAPIRALTDAARTLSAFLEKLDLWRELSGAVPLSRLLFTVLRDTGLYAYLGALPAGSQRQANLDALISRAEGYEANQPGGLSGFLQYVEQMTAAQEDLGEAHTLSENDDVVRVMTVHKSKGLEFPVVIGIQLGGKIARAQSELLCAHKQLGLGMEHIDCGLGTRRDTISRQAILRRMAAENNAEALRILFATPGVKAVLINIFGGITRCDEVAGGVKLALERGALDGKLIVVRMEGTNKDKAIAIIDGLHSDVVRVEGLRESIAALQERRDRL